MRYLIAVDEKGVYLRETLCVTHSENTGEVRYDAKPVPVSSLPLDVSNRIICALMSAQREQANGR